LASCAAQVFDYDADGNLLGSPTPQTDLLYAGEMIEPYLGWYYNRARWYDPTTGRFNRTDAFAGNHSAPPNRSTNTFARLTAELM
jgi:RHS repeat-associated protein